MNDRSADLDGDCLRDDYAQMWVEEVLAALGAIRSPGRNGKWQCPAHARSGDHAPSLAVGIRDGGGAWVYCHAGCTAREVSGALGLTLDQLRHPPRISAERWVACRRLPVGFAAPRTGGTPRSLGYVHEAFHQYGPDFRLERLRHPRSGDKAVQWEARNEHGEWVPGLLGTREADLPLYREHEVVAAVALGEIVLVVESESSVDALRGWYATTWAGGAGSPPLGRIARLLGDHDRVVIIADADEAGRRCTARLVGVLPHAVALASKRDGEDARDLYDRLGADVFSDVIASRLRRTNSTD